MKKYFVLFLFVFMFLTSCTGPQGDTGLTGTEGPAGPEQPGIYYIRLFQNNIYSSSYTGQVQAALFNGYGGPYYTDASNPVNLGLSDVGGVYRAIFKFDLSALPLSKVIVDKAELIIKTNSASYGGGAQDVTIHKITEPWVEFEVGWENSSNTSQWTSGGGDFSSNTITPDAYSRDILPDSTITIELDPGVVLSWLTNPLTNYGLLMKTTVESSTANYSEIYSGGAATETNRPLLKVWYYTRE